ncbi:hypothetical protein ACFFRR_005000 [Megaselia abdita]
MKDKQCTIPKLELEALVTLANLLKIIIKKSFSHRLIRMTAYTDSQVAMSWVRSNKEIHKKIVERRVIIIKEVIDPLSLHYTLSQKKIQRIQHPVAYPLINFLIVTFGLMDRIGYKTTTFLSPLLLRKQLHC